MRFLIILEQLVVLELIELTELIELIEITRNALKKTRFGK